MDDRPIDLTALDPTRDPSFDTRSRRIAADAMAARRAAPRPLRLDVFGELAGWSRPLLAAAAVILAVTVPTLSYMSGAKAPRARGATTSELLGIPAKLVDLASSGQAPTVTQLADALAPDQGGPDGR